MMLPILISVSVAPGSYFFCACAGAAIIAAATSETRTTRLVRRSMRSSRLFVGSVASRACAGKNGLIPQDETEGCCGRPDVLSMPDIVGRIPFEADRLEAQKLRIGPRFP